MIDPQYLEWKHEQDYVAFNDFCCNLGIEIDDTSILRDDDILFDLIIREHDNHFGIEHDQDAYVQHLEDEEQGRYEDEQENISDSMRIDEAFN